MSNWACYLISGLTGATLIVPVWLVSQVGRYHVGSVTVNLPFALGSIALHPSSCEREMAWRLYVELRTRKGALPFDDENDVIVEVYDSLYELFPIIRNMLSSIPPRKVTQYEGLSNILLRVQGDGLRPHLTRWQAAFRRWWDKALGDPENIDKPPQEIQRQYPRYEELVNDLKTTNTELSRLADELIAIARPPKQKFVLPWKRRPILPEAPTSVSEPLLK